MHPITITIVLLSVALTLPRLAAADFDAGLRAYERGDFTTAQTQFTTAAEAGDADAQYMLGRLYASGNGTAQDFVQAYKWYNLAAAAGQRFAAPVRDVLADAMTTEQIAEAQALTRNWGTADNDDASDGSSALAAAVTAKPQTQNFDLSTAATAAEELSETTITQIQLGLKRLGYEVGAIDGRLSAQTLTAISDYQSEHELIVDGRASRALLEHLRNNRDDQIGIRKSESDDATETPRRSANWRRLL